MYSFFKANKLIAKNRSTFTPVDSGTGQLLSLIHDVHVAFDGNSCLEVRSVYLDMSKAFDKNWHEEFLFKLKQNGIDGNLLVLLANYLSNRRQRVIPNVQKSEWAPILSGRDATRIHSRTTSVLDIHNLETGIISQIRSFAVRFIW